jgi:peptidase E
MQLHLFSAAPDPFPDALLEIVRPLLTGADDPCVAYLPAGSLERHFIREAKAIFRGLAQVSAIKAETHSLKRTRSILERVTLLFVPGGNTYLMAHRLYALGIVAELRQRIVAGLPLVAFSAGTVFCGQDILTTNDINCCGCIQFAGLGLLPCNFNAHYPSEEGLERERRDERLGEYMAFHDTPVLALEDSAYVRVLDGKLEVVRGGVWEFRRGQGKIKLSPQALTSGAGGQSVEIKGT